MFQKEYAKLTSINLWYSSNLKGLKKLFKNFNEKSVKLSIFSLSINLERQNWTFKNYAGEEWYQGLIKDSIDQGWNWTRIKDWTRIARRSRIETKIFAENWQQLEKSSLDVANVSLYDHVISYCHKKILLYLVNIHKKD